MALADGDGVAVAAAVMLSTGGRGGGGHRGWVALGEAVPVAVALTAGVAVADGLGGADDVAVAVDVAASDAVTVGVTGVADCVGPVPWTTCTRTRSARCRTSNARPLPISRPSRLRELAVARRERHDVERLSELRREAIDHRQVQRAAECCGTADREAVVLVSAVRPPISALRAAPPVCVYVPVIVSWPGDRPGVGLAAVADVGVHGAAPFQSATGERHQHGRCQRAGRDAGDARGLRVSAAETQRRRQHVHRAGVVEGHVDVRRAGVAGGGFAQRAAVVDGAAAGAA